MMTSRPVSFTSVRRVFWCMYAISPAAGSDLSTMFLRGDQTFKVAEALVSSCSGGALRGQTFHFLQHDRASLSGETLIFELRSLERQTRNSEAQDQQAVTLVLSGRCSDFGKCRQQVLKPGFTLFRGKDQEQTCNWATNHLRPSIQVLLWPKLHR
jgi:hypothetical protein